MTRQKLNADLTPDASKRGLKVADRFVPRMTQPQAMKTQSYVYGVERLNGFDAWAMFVTLNSEVRRWLRQFAVVRDKSPSKLRAVARWSSFY